MGHNLNCDARCPGPRGGSWTRLGTARLAQQKHQRIRVRGFAPVVALVSLGSVLFASAGCWYAHARRCGEHWLLQKRLRWGRVCGGSSWKFRPASEACTTWNAERSFPDSRRTHSSRKGIVARGRLLFGKLSKSCLQNSSHDPRSLPTLSPPNCCQELEVNKENSLTVKSGLACVR